MSYIHVVIAGLIAGCIAGPLVLFGQTSNKPTTVTQVPTPAGPVAPTPGSYLVNGLLPPVNYIRERDGLGRITDMTVFDAATYTDVKQATQYLDDLGRPLQTVLKQASPGTSPNDVVAPVIYDADGRESYKYLPYVQTSNNTNDGLFKVDPFNAQKQFYQNVYPIQQPALSGEQVCYGQVQYEPSPLNRVTETLAPGNSWAGSNVGVSKQYLVNSAADNVVMWNISSAPLTYVNNDVSTNIPAFGGYYPAGQLYKNVTTDEQGHSVVEYKDMDGLLILKKVQIGSIPGDLSGYSGWLSTYYIYDDLKQLRFILSPKAVTVADGNGWNLNADATTLNELCYRYEYDFRQRMIAKKVPAAGWVYMIYDLRDRLVYTQDANMRGNSQWMSTLFDALNRPIATGMITYSGTASQLQSFVTANTAGSTASSVTITGSSSGTFPANLDLAAPAENGVYQALNSIALDSDFSTTVGAEFTAEIVTGVPVTQFSNNIAVTDNALPPGNNFIGLTMTFYDNYVNTPDKQYSTTYNNLLDAGTNAHAETLPSSANIQVLPTNGLVTGTRVRVIENPNNLTQGAWLETANFYDDRARVVQTQADNYKGGQDITTTLYNFTNQPITTYLAHNNPMATTNNNTRIKTNFNLDQANRLLQVYKTINDQANTNRLIAQQSYDQLGRLMQKQLGQLTGGSFLETQDYTYNIRGWLKGINRDYANNDNTRGADNRWFGTDLSYDWGFASNQLNGNVSGNVWRSKGDGYQRAYGFGYDDANRLLFADFNQYGSNWDKTAGVDFSSTMGNGTDPSSAYDENGNIQAMTQMAWQVGGSKPIDILQYNYLTNSNRLQNVVDGANDPTTTLGDFRTSALSPYHAAKDATAVDYYYDVNGNLTRDLNRDIGTQATDGIIYNHLNLPWQVTVQSATGSKGTITYVFDALGNRLKKTTMDNAANLQTVTTYIGPFQYQGTGSINSGATPADNLQFFGHEEGRVRVKTDNSSGQPVTSYVYDFFLKDQLRNTRMVLTDDQETDQYPMATMEQSNSTLEDLYYTMLDETRTLLPPGYPSDPTTNPNAYVAKLHVGSDNQPVIGPGIVLKVMAGDQFNVRVTSWYQLNGTTPQANNTSPVTDIVTAMIAGLGRIQGENPLASALQSNNSSLGSNIGQFTTAEGSAADITKPQAFLNWVLLDNQFNYVGSSSGFRQVGGDGQLTTPILTNLPINSSGYLYIYTSNATPNIDVFFDNLQVTHTRGPLLEENHYYPFGLTMAGISGQALEGNYEENKFRFQMQELQNKEFSDGSGLEEYEFKYRFDDPQIGRFTRVDPLCDSFPANSPYAFSENKVTGNVELEGLEIATIQDVFRSGGITESYGNQIANSVSRTMVKAGRMSADALIIVGGVVILVASDGAATPLFIMASGGLAVSGGTAKLILDAQGKYEQSDETPSTVSGTAIYTINEAVGPDKHGNKVFSKEFQATVEFVEGVATLKIAGFEKMSSVDQVNAVISTVNLLISSKDIPDNVKAMLKKSLMTNLNTTTNPTPASDHPEDEHWKHAIPNIPQMN